MTATRMRMMLTRLTSPGLLAGLFVLLAAALPATALAATSARAAVVCPTVGSSRAGEPGPARRRQLVGL